MKTKRQIGRLEAILIKGLRKIRMGWCKGADARNASGRDVDTESESACKWCAAGAVNYNQLAIGQLKVAAGIQTGGLTTWNDSTTKGRVVEIYKKSIAAARAKGI